MTPQWRLSLKKKGGKRSGAGRKHSRRNGFGKKKKIFRGSRKKLVWVSYEQVTQRHGHGGAFGGETRQERTDALRLGATEHETHSDPQFLPLMSDRRHSGESQLWNNSQEVVKCFFFLRSVPLESFGTCVKAAAPQRPSESIQPVLEKKEA